MGNWQPPRASTSRCSAVSKVVMLSGSFCCLSLSLFVVCSCLSLSLFVVVVVISMLVVITAGVVVVVVLLLLVIFVLVVFVVVIVFVVASFNGAFSLFVCLFVSLFLCLLHFRCCCCCCCFFLVLVVVAVVVVVVLLVYLSFSLSFVCRRRLSLSLSCHRCHVCLVHVISL